MSKVADRKVTVDGMSEPKAYLTAESNSKPTPDKLSAMEKQMEKVMAFIAKGQNQNGSSYKSLWKVIEKKSELGSM